MTDVVRVTLVSHAMTDAMAAGREWFLALWRNPVATTALYGALLTHWLLGLWLVSNVGYSFFRVWILGALVFWAVAGYCNGEVASAARTARSRSCSI